jgi:hypothetical protein
MMRQDAWAFNVIVDQSKPEQMLMMVDRNDANDAIRSSGAKVRLALSFPYLSLSLSCLLRARAHPCPCSQTIFLRNGDEIRIKGKSVSFIPRQGDGDLRNRFLFHDHSQLVQQHNRHLEDMKGKIEAIVAQHSANTKDEEVGHLRRLLRI